MGLKTSQEKRETLVNNIFQPSKTSHLLHHILFGTTRTFKRSSQSVSNWQKWMILHRFPYKPLFLSVCSNSLLKTLREKENLLATSNFYLSHIVFYPFGELSAILSKFKIFVCSFSLEESKICRLGKG